MNNEKATEAHFPHHAILMQAFEAHVECHLRCLVPFETDCYTQVCKRVCVLK
jgi:hypothetical protein